MERDSRRHRGEWRGCHNFDKIICDGDVPTSSERRGGLKMGQRYYYYVSLVHNPDTVTMLTRKQYEVDGSTETYNPSLPTTTACPFLPGQTVNTLDVPAERRTRMKSASMNSLRTTDFKTMDPTDRFTAPRVPPVPSHRREFRIASASSIFPKRATRSVSPAPSWTGTARRFLGFKSQNRDRESDRGRMYALNEADDVFVEEQDPSTQSRSATPSGSIRSRDLSPESLRRFLSDDLPACATPEPAPSFSIPDDIEEEVEDNDDDHNFATATTSDANLFTNLSPPPFQRGGLSAPPASHSKNSTILTPPAPTPAPVRRALMRLDIPRSHSAESTASSSIASTASPHSNISRGMSQFSFFDDSEDDEDITYEGDRTLLGANRDVGMRKNAPKLELRAPITSYSLPPASTDNAKHINTDHVLESPALVARNDNEVSVDTNNFFGLPNVDIGLDDLVSDANWMNEVIRQKGL
ncbi:hypothetical protein ONZ43_g827 [Nemania bipapillata]|uniref:Uncharacterized protein n=1 Tax=Nemania bipapillata TaxID=110536 RepID=A0ACC2J6Q6_9PEZI|nr:hypothetical protein ONZ43_g827 [Nemania bipapillata]